MTNGDRLRQMSDEELLEFFFGPEAYTISLAIPIIETQGGMQMQHIITKRYIDWMKEEATQ